MTENTDVQQSVRNVAQSDMMVLSVEGLQVQTQPDNVTKSKKQNKIFKKG